jgi:hypothetical protein
MVRRHTGWGVVSGGVALVLAQACGDGGSGSGAGGAEGTIEVRKVGYTDCGDNISSCTQLVLDASGRVLISTAYSEDCGSSPCAERNTFSYGSGLQPSSVAVDRNCDGSTDWIFKYTYDSSGRISTTEYDNDGDGVTDGSSCSTSEPIADVVVARLDADCDGDTKRCWARTRDSNGLILAERELVAPECTGGSDCRSYEYDASGSVTVYTFDSSCNGSTELEVCYEYVD